MEAVNTTATGDVHRASKGRPTGAGRRIVMEMPRLTGYPFDQEIVARLRTRQRAREAAWRARRTQRPERSGLWGFLQRLAG